MTEAPSPNLELALDVLAAIERDPDGHDQGLWAYRSPCRTTYCAAGHAVIQAGEQLVWQEDDYNPGAYTAGCTTTGEHVMHAAQRLLGLTGEEATTVFCTAGDLNDLYAEFATIFQLDERVLRDKVRDRV